MVSARLHHDSLTIICQTENREKTENTHRKWLDIIFSVPQGSTLGPLPLIFNFF